MRDFFQGLVVRVLGVLGSRFKFWFSGLGAPFFVVVVQCAVCMQHVGFVVVGSGLLRTPRRFGPFPLALGGSRVGFAEHVQN